MTSETITTEEDKDTEPKSREASSRESSQKTYYETDSWLDIPEEVETKFMDQGVKL